MQNPIHSWALLGLVIAVLLMAPAPRAAADTLAPTTQAELLEQIQELARQNRVMQEQIRTLQEDVKSARQQAQAASDRAAVAESALPKVSAAQASLGPAESPDAGLLSRQVGAVNFQLLDISLDTLFAFGWSSADDEDLVDLQGGGHDPRQRGFNLQQVELGLSGAVDPFFTADAFLIYFIDPEGESRFELEEAFATTSMLPFGLHEQGFQVEVGQMFTEYGRQNPTHAHAWDWQDQPVVNTRLFGEDGARNPGFRVGWLAPLPWFSEVHVGVQNAKGETMVSFLGNEEVFEERSIGGRPFANPGVRNLGDLTYLARWVNGFDVSDTWSAQWGVSGLFGPNGTGRDGRTNIAGTDLVVKWRPLATERGWPFLNWTTEFSYRWYDADDFFGCPEPGGDCDPVALASDTLRDWGLYTELLWGFRRSWSAGLRYEYAAGSGDDVAFDEDTGDFVSVSRQTDPFRDDRHRVSPLLVFHPSEFSRLRLQYNYDHARHLDGDSAHTGWLGVEFLFGSHAAHNY